MLTVLYTFTHLSTGILKKINREHVVCVADGGPPEDQGVCRGHLGQQRERRVPAAGACVGPGRDEAQHGVPGLLRQLPAHRHAHQDPAPQATLLHARCTMGFFHLQNLAGVSFLGDFTDFMEK